MIFLMPVAIALHAKLRPAAPGTSLLVLALGAMLGVVLMQGLPVLRQVRFETTLQAVLILSGVLGLWWIATRSLWLVEHCGRARCPFDPGGLLARRAVAPARRRGPSDQRRFVAPLGFLDRPASAVGCYLDLSHLRSRSP